jgi:lipoteichoic acid synthase
MLNHKQLWKSPFFIITLALFLKMLLLRTFLFNNVGFKGYLFELGFIIILTSLTELLVPRKVLKISYLMLNLILSMIFFAATLYHEHFGSIITYTSLYEFKQLKQVSGSVKATIFVQDYLFFADFLIFFILFLFLKARGQTFFRVFPFRKYTVVTLMLIGTAISFSAVKFDNHSVNELVHADQLGVLNYELTTIVKKKTTQFSSLSEASDAINQAEAAFGYQTQTNETTVPNQFGAAKGKNLIMIQMEAFQNFPINLLLDGVELTPNLNKLARESYYFPHFFQQIGQGNTSDAEFISNTSIYPTGTIPMSTGYGNRSLPSLPKLLADQGYDTNTFHVNDVTFWDRNKLYPALGFDHFYDKPSYVNDNFNVFGASDVELYSVGIEKLKAIQSQNKPFYAQFITASSHHPFKIPEDQKKISIPASLVGKQLGDYLLAINYTDYAIGQFIDQLKANGLWNNTVLIAYGDHFGLQPQDNDPAFVSQELGITYQPDVSRFNIPLFIHVPKQKSKVIDQVGGQLDIMPTVANLLGISLRQETYIHLGEDLLNIDKNVFGMRYYLPTGSFFNNDILFIPGKSFEDGKAVSLKTLEPVIDFTQYKADYDYVMNLMHMSDGYVQLLPRRVIE